MTSTGSPSTLRTLLARLARDDRGATAVEYGLLVACLTLLVIGGVSATGTNIAGVMNKLSNALR